MNDIVLHLCVMLRKTVTELKTIRCTDHSDSDEMRVCGGYFVNLGVCSAKFTFANGCLI